MRIPNSVNTVWDWADKHVKALGITIVLIVAAGAALVLPTLAALVIGVFVGGVVVQVRMNARAARLRSDIDDLLRENGALRHERTVLAGGVLQAEEQATTALPIMAMRLRDEAEQAADPGTGDGPRPDPANGLASDHDGETKRLTILPED